LQKELVGALAQALISDMNRALMFVGWLFFVAPIATLGQGTVAFDSFGPGNSYNYWAAMWLDSSRTHAGFAFTPTASGRLHSIDLPITRESLSPASIQVALCRLNLETGFPTSTLELFATEAVPTRTAEPVPPISFRSSLEPVIEANAEYWLVVSHPDGSEFNWYGISRDVETGYYFKSDQQGEGFAFARPPSAFRVTVTQVPEPATIGLVASGIFMLAFAKRRTRVYSDNSPR
jgi:hypothetical protein